ncbi:UDP-N-acetylmuramoyl-L-alanine--D-glutamate ligase [Sphingomonas sp. RB56-2]|uniref:UDP-N-acetylmuramoylalanine--D-glutamate ligase n=1 Tax=Sphingomonas brevis TaxID=2908206 RepID=A0ABT0S601_9SPHN|nr:UDP-N-acetylmuramoyl-L-alanine--D-glutamate ligase [Sphingomonas brevis]
MIAARAFAGKHYAVLGLARSGLATVEALLASGAKVTAWDDKEEARAKAPAGVELEDFVDGDLKRFDSIVVTPGLPLNRHSIAQRAREAGVEIIGDIELFARARAELPPHKVVGITGTNGKSTTTALVHHILKTAGWPTEMGGNIGLPILAQDPLPEGGVYVLELSSYQIDLTKSLDCDVAVLLNITPDHLDRYEDFEAYAASKLRLFEMQTPEHNMVVSVTEARDFDIPSQGVVASFIEDVFDFKALKPSEQRNWAALQGPHNLENASASVEVCDILKLSIEQIRDGLRTYPGLPHRMERIREKEGVLYVNDSKATNPTATAPALAAFPKIRWILGGQAKTDNLDECAPHFGHVVKAYTIGEAGEMFATLLSPQMEVAECVTLDEAVRAAASEALAGETVLLSPACASFDQFRDFEARGDAFRALVGEL